MFTQSSKKYFYTTEQIKETRDRKFVTGAEKELIAKLAKRIDELEKLVKELQDGAAAPAKKTATKKAAAKEEKAEE